LLRMLFLSFSKSWLQTLQERFAPLIGAVVMIIVIMAIVLFIVWWSRYWVKKGLEELERQRGEVRLQLQAVFDYVDCSLETVKSA